MSYFDFPGTERDVLNDLHVVDINGQLWRPADVRFGKNKLTPAEDDRRMVPIISVCYVPMPMVYFEDEQV